MFIRVKTTPNSPRKSVQIVESFRVGGKITQKIVKHIGVAIDDEQLEELKLLALSIKSKLELENILPLYTPEEIERQIEISQNNLKKEIYSDEDYIVNVKDLIEEGRVINAYGIVGMIPIKGIAVPFLSYGGSSMLAMSIGVGMVLMVSKRAASSSFNEEL